MVAFVDHVRSMSIECSNPPSYDDALRSGTYMAAADSDSKCAAAAESDSNEDDDDDEEDIDRLAWGISVPKLKFPDTLRLDRDERERVGRGTANSGTSALGADDWVCIKRSVARRSPAGRRLESVCWCLLGPE
jgi:hypothetical protein